MDFIVPVFSSLLFVFLSISVFSYRKSTNFRLEIRMISILIYIAVKVLAFYLVTQNADGDDFRSDYYVIGILLLEGGLLILRFVNFITRHHFHLQEEFSYTSLVFSLVFDYFVFLALSILKRRRKAWMKAKARRGED